MRRALVLPTLLFLALQVGPLAAQAKPAAPDLKGVDQVITAMMTDFHVPGLGVGIIKGDQIVLARGYGFRDVEAKVPVTARTLFAIGSNSKSFTATLMAMLVDEGKLDWTKPVRTWLPDFELYDEYAARNMTPMDLVSHVSGLPRHDPLWYGRAFTRQEIYRRLKYLEPSTSFRNIWQYNNLMFMTAGILTERVSGKSWEEQVRSRIFTPLGMTRATTSVTDMARSDDFSWPYDYKDGKVVRIPFRNIDQIGPAGSINASVEDMLKYVDFRMHFGKVGDKQLVAAKQDSLEQTPRAVIPGTWTFKGVPEMGPETYGLALAIIGYRGHKLVMHGGGIDGFISQMAWLPDEKIGVVVLSNTNNSDGGGNPLPNALALYLMDRMLGLAPLDWAGKARQQAVSGDSATKAERAEELKNRVAGTSPSHPLDDYAGSYENEGYGTLVIRRGAQGLELALDQLQTPLEHVHYDVFNIAPGAPMIEGRISFGLDDKGAITTVSVPMAPGVKPIVFTRKTK
jgi:CubicO group peptidase (beta-lactamase class C family)